MPSREGYLLTGEAQREIMEDALKWAGNPCGEIRSPIVFSSNPGPMHFGQVNKNRFGSVGRQSGKSLTTNAYVHWATEESGNRYIESQHKAGDACPICKSLSKKGARISMGATKQISKFEAMGTD